MKSIQELILNNEYQSCRLWIQNARDNQKTWDEIDFACKGNQAGLDSFLLDKQEDDFWIITSDEWHLLVKEMKDVEEGGKPGFIGDPKKTVLGIPTSQGSCWVRYKKKLESPNTNFTYANVQNIEISSQKIVSQLEIRTEQNDPVRGMVVGNVQSGKTANMAGVIAMAADYGYNFFIILTGTIENLRKQTRERLISDLNSENCNIDFRSLDYLSTKTPYPDRLQDLFLSDTSNKRYISVCLKNSTRLRDLLNWLNVNPMAKGKLKVVLIDDEADQAGVNTKDVDTKEQTAISRLIKNLVFGRNSKDQKASPYQCMNYIGYTATPYANFLNESGNETLYPKNFISLLNTASEYFGPQQIFGVDDVNEGLNIINSITEDEVSSFNDDLVTKNNLPQSLKESLFWFIITVASARFWKIESPISMLIHTSQIVDKHFRVSNAIEGYLSGLNKSKCLAEIEKVFDEQTKMFSIEEFKENMPDYNELDKVKNYPSFDEILPYIKELLDINITHIELSDEGTLQYNKGLHLCVDNCRKNALNNEFEMRIVYPEKGDSIIKETPAFIIIGGTTLSRGLTLKGLTTSYFLRSTSQADTLMQMGRWFGYRHKYEMLPRIWLSAKTASRFKRLTKLDYDLRNELSTMELKGLSPKDYAPRLDHFPDYQLLVLTSKKKMQKSIEFKCTFYNKTAQTTWFYKDDETITANYNLAISFLNSLGPLDLNARSKLKNDIANNNKGSHIWFNVDFNTVLEFLEKIKIPENQAAVFKDFYAFKKWYSDEFDKGNLKNWTVVAGGVVNKIQNDVELDNGTVIHLETRSRVESEGPLAKDYTKYVDLNTITQTPDRLMDIDCSNLSKFEIEEINSNKLKFIEKRNKYASGTNPLLVVYIIDKDGGKGDEVKYIASKNRKRLPLETLHLANHIVGYYIYIPYGKSDDNPDYITVKLNYDEDEAEVDLDENEN